MFKRVHFNISLVSVAALRMSSVWILLCFFLYSMPKAETMLWAIPLRHFHRRDRYHFELYLVPLMLALNDAGI